MRTEPVTITGLAGPVVVTMNAFTGRHSVTVNGQPAVKSGRRDYNLPTVDGHTVAATLRSSLFDPYPTIEIAGVKHRTGPTAPVALRVLILLPLALLALGGLIGGVIGGATVYANLGIARTRQPTTIKAVLMIVLFGAGFSMWAAVAALATR